MIDLSKKDLDQLADKGISEAQLTQQMNTFKKGIPFVDLARAAIVDDGIFRFDAEQQQQLVSFFDDRAEGLSLLKFVPASGAASRMFKAMFNFLEAYDPEAESLGEYLSRTNDAAVERFAKDMERFPFYGEIMKAIGSKHGEAGSKVYAFVKYMLEEDGMNFGFFPKGLLPFHKCKHGGATPFKEHLKEAALYAKGKGLAKLHFTISPQHETMFKDEEALSVPRISQKTETEFEVTYSNQKPSTDTLAVDMEDRPFRNSDGSILFRPGGHGALIENLNDQDADIIFIKNIDNVVIDANLQQVADSKKMLAGLLLRTQEKAFDYARALENETADVVEVKRFLETELNVRFEQAYEALDEAGKQTALLAKLNRPIRVCGMVKNEGEPGGGPFWAKNSQGGVSLQIIESAQVDMSSSSQAAIFKDSTHFNPVDLVCGPRDYRGKKFDLMPFIDTEQGFITAKTKEGKELKALELPGLWNGAMAYWNTLFVEVPLVTFNPVKTVNDLLKPSHQAG
ncbi:MAG: DUF4301 family protein [Flavobacteriaceae bacterium]|nr:DUF4301 family protein [Flavobacteriaceae bacterium]